MPGHSRYDLALLFGDSYECGSDSEDSDSDNWMVRRQGRKRKRTGTSGYRVKNLERRLARIEGNVETKRHDTVFTLADLSNGWIWTHVTGIAQGTTFATRIGNVIRGKHLKVSGELFLAASTVEVVVRVVILEVSQSQIDAPVTADVFNVNDYGSLRNSNPGQNVKYRTLFDKKWTLQPGGAEIALLEVWRAIGLIAKHSYEGTTGGTGDDGRGAIYVGHITNAAANFPKLRFVAQYGFQDA